MRIFLSYARSDAGPLRLLVEGLEHIGHDVWLDAQISGGQEWWDAILAAIRGSDAVLIGVSVASLGSEPCARERRYATALGKPLVPVLLERIPLATLPADLASVQLVDFAEPDARAAFMLISALSHLTPTDLPTPLPAPPPAPISPLSYLVEEVSADSLTLEAQHVVVAKLKAALHNGGDVPVGRAIIDRLANRGDLYAAVSRELDELRRTLAGPPAAIPTPAAISTPGARQPPRTEDIDRVIAEHEPIKKLRRGPAISERHRQKVTRQFPLEGGETIRAVFDLTMFGGNGDFLALTDRRILYTYLFRHSRSYRYTELMPDDIGLLQNTVYVSGTGLALYDVNAKQAKDLLVALVRLVHSPPAARPGS